jgi:hypothetical protein
MHLNRAILPVLWRDPVSSKPAEHFRSTPGGYFHGRVAKAKDGELNLTRTVWGLRQTTASGSPRGCSHPGSPSCARVPDQTRPAPECGRVAIGRRRQVRVRWVVLVTSRPTLLGVSLSLDRETGKPGLPPFGVFLVHETDPRMMRLCLLVRATLAPGSCDRQAVEMRPARPPTPRIFA